MSVGVCVDARIRASAFLSAFPLACERALHWFALHSMVWRSMAWRDVASHSVA